MHMYYSVGFSKLAVRTLLKFKHVSDTPLIYKPLPPRKYSMVARG